MIGFVLFYESNITTFTRIKQIKKRMVWIHNKYAMAKIRLTIAKLSNKNIDNAKSGNNEQVKNQENRIWMN